VDQSGGPRRAARRRIRAQHGAPPLPRPQALPEWKKALEEMANHPKVAMVKVARNELDRQFSVFNRFSPPGTKFDCTFVRKPGEVRHRA
jgi:hypothetical protein